MEYITNVKIQVTPEKTREISKIVLDNGGRWNGNKTKHNNWLIIRNGGDIEWSTSSNLKCYSECNAQDWIDDFYSKVPKYNFKFLEENDVALHIPTFQLAEDFLIQLSKYRKFKLSNYNYGLDYYNDNLNYFKLYNENEYDAYEKCYLDKDTKIISWSNFITRENLEDYLESNEEVQMKNKNEIIQEGTIVLAKRNDGYQTQGKYFGYCNGKHIVDFNGTSAMLYDYVEVLETLTKKEAKQKVSELFANPKNVTSDKIRNIIDLIKI